MRVAMQAQRVWSIARSDMVDLYLTICFALKQPFVRICISVRKRKSQCSYRKDEGKDKEAWGPSHIRAVAFYSYS